MSEDLELSQPFYSLPWIEGFAINLVIAIVILVIGWWISSFAGRTIRRAAQRSARIDPTIVPIAQSVVEWTIRIFVIIAVLARFGVQTASIIAVLGAAGLAVGLALQNTLQNIAAGVMLLVLRPLRAGEFVTVVGKGDGTVQEIGLFLTRFVQVDGVHFSLPNSAVWGSAIINYSRNETRRMEIEIGVRYDDDIDLALQTLQSLLDEHADILKDPAPIAVVTSYKENHVNISMRCWIETSKFWGVRFYLNKTAVQELQKVGLRHPIPVREVQNISEQNKAA
ncbi:MAG TPA: mechanosensitive ion channel domain-containing protein [Paenalcaligenes sp.]|nr:mechanosensitive ion channel domain-containing protein [Paenalcaligenes sp.]